MAYHGACFAGFCRQVERTTVEGVLRTALTSLDPHLKAMAFAGATDRGVHAWDQVVSFRVRRRLDLATVQEAVQALAPAASASPTGFEEVDEVLAGRALMVREVTHVPRRFHASFSARSRRYRFRLRADADVDAVDALLRALVGTRDVRALARQPRRGGSTRKTILAAGAERDGAYLCFDVTASGFLRRQMRVLVATVLREAEAGAPASRMVELCATGDPRQTAPPMSPDGLCLWHVDYGVSSETSVPSLAVSTSPNDDQSSASSEAVSHRPSR